MKLYAVRLSLTVFLFLASTLTLWIWEGLDLPAIRLHGDYERSTRYV